MNPDQTPQNNTAGGNRITFTSQTLTNGTINIGGGSGTNAVGGGAGGTTIISTSQLPNTTTIKTITSSAGTAGTHHTLPQQVQVQHHQVLQAAGTGSTTAQTNAHTTHHQHHQQQQQQMNAAGVQHQHQQQQPSNQPLLNSMIPASVVVGMRSPAPQQGQQAGVQANTLSRVVTLAGPRIGVGARQQNPGITLSSLPQGNPPSALILRTDNGLQLLRLNPATSSAQVTSSNSGGGFVTAGTNSTNPTQIRLQTLPAASITAVSTGTTIVNHSVASTNSSHVYTTQANMTNISQQQQQQQQQQQLQQQIQHQTQHLNAQPQITQIQTIPAQPLPQQQQNTPNQNATQVNTSISNSGGITNATPTTSSITTTTTTQNTAAQGNTKEKCRKFLANLIDLSTREPKPVERNVRNLIQELVNANVEPEEFCDRLERLLNASPQPCLIGFLKKSLPLLRHALYTKELTIEGIRPPPQHVVGVTTLHQLPRIQAQIRPITQNQTLTIGQTQVRMVTPPAPVPRPLHRTITNQQTVRSPSPNNGGQRLVTTATIRGPVIHPLIAGQTGITTIRPAVPVSGPLAARPNAVQIRTTRPKGGIVKVSQAPNKTIPGLTSTVSSTQPPSLTAISSNNALSNHYATQSSMLSTINSVASAGTTSNTMLPTPSLPTVQLPASLISANTTTTIGGIGVGGGAGHADKSSILDTSKFGGDKIATIAINNNNNNSNIISTNTVASTAVKTVGLKSTIASSTNKAISKKKKEQTDKDKDEKSLITANSTAAAAANASSSFFQQPSLALSSTVYGDDDINDVAAMGGVNLAEESQRIMGCTENIGTQIRSCKDEVFLHLPTLQARIRARMIERGLEEPSQDVAVLMSHACQERLKNIVEQLVVIAEHRNDVIKLDPRYEVSKDVRGQIKFLEELDKAEQKRHEEMEREILLRAAKSRSKIEDPEQAKMKARAKEMQRAEMEELRQRDANMTALQAIGPRKKIKIDNESSGIGGVSTTGSSLLSGNNSGPAPLRPRIKRVNLRDMLFFMEQDRDLCRSNTLYAAYLK